MLPSQTCLFSPCVRLSTVAEIKHKNSQIHLIVLWYLSKSTFHHCRSQCFPSHYCPFAQVWCVFFWFMIWCLTVYGRYMDPPRSSLYVIIPSSSVYYCRFYCMYGNNCSHLPIIQHHCPITKILFIVWNTPTALVFTFQMLHDITKHEGKFGGKIKIRTKAVAADTYCYYKFGL